MSKPLGMGISITPSGPLLSVSRPSHVENTIWEAVREAVCAGWTVQHFKTEAASAWADEMKRQAKDDAQEWSKP